MVSVEVTGLRELGEALKAFPVKLAQKYLRKATSNAAALIRDDAKKRVPVRTGAVRDAISVFKKRSDGNSAHYAVGVRKIKFNRKEKTVLRILRKQNGGKKVDLAGSAFYWRFLEFGTAKMGARPFLRPAFESKKMAAIETFRVSLADGVEKAAREVRR